MDGRMAIFDSVEELIKTARNGRSQKDFADLLQVDQSMVSKYERGKASPPIAVINHCMRLVHIADSEATPSAEELAERVRVTMANPNLGPMRLALSRLVEAVESGHGYVSSPARLRSKGE